MNYRPLLCLAFVALLLTSCGGGGERAAMLDRADSLSYVRPDSALSLLDSLRPEKDKWQESQRMHFELLYVKALDKADQPLPADSFMRQIVAYYEDDGDLQLLPLAYYYAARSCRTHGDAPQALDYLQKALSLLGDDQLQLRAVACSQSGYLYSQQKLYRLALNAFREAYRCDSLLNDTTGMIYNLRDLGFNYENVEARDSAIIYMERAMKLAEMHRNEKMIMNITTQLALTNYHLEKYNDALKLIRSAITYNDKANKGAVFSIASKIYQALNMPDSALFCYHILKDLPSVYSKRAAYRGFSDFYTRKGDIYAAHHFFSLYRELSDSIDKITATATVAQMNSLYNYQLRENENKRLSREKEEKEKLLQLISYTVCLAVFFLIIGFLYIRHRHLVVKIRIERKKRVEALTELANIQGSQSKAPLLISSDSELIKTIQRKLNDPKNTNKLLTQSEWNELENLIETCFPKFKFTILDICRLTTFKLQLCLLLKCGFSIADIAQLTQHSSEAITSARRRMAKKAFGPSSTPADWDAFIQSL